MNTLLVASGVGVVFLALVGWQIHAAYKRRARRRPMALVVADAIMVGANIPRGNEPAPGTDAAWPKGMRRSQPVVSGLEKLGDGQWGFSLHDADKVMVTFAYPARDKAETALKAMRRVRKDMAFALQPAEPHIVQRAEKQAEMPWELDGSAPVAAPRVFAEDQLWRRA